MRKRILVLFAWVGSALMLSGGPTEMREWKSTAGSAIKGKALAMSDGMISFETADGRKLEVPLDKLVEEDQAFLEYHFDDSPFKELRYPAPQLEHPLGQIAGPVQAAEGSSYYVYFPKTMADGAEAPLLFWTGAEGAGEEVLKRFQSVSELTGMVVACSVEAKGLNQGYEMSHEHTKKCLAHIEANFPVDSERVFFSGDSAGGASALYNAVKLKSAGAMPIGGYLPEKIRLDDDRFYFVASGISDYHRYLSAEAARQAGDSGVHRLFSGGHGPGTAEMVEEGVLWLYTSHLYQGDFPEEKTRFEPRVYAYVTDLAKKKPYLAFFWVDHLIHTCELEGRLEAPFEVLDEELSAEPENESYLEGRLVLGDISNDIFSEFYSIDSPGDHTAPNIQEAAEELAEVYEGVPEIAELAAELKEPTQAQEED